MKTKRILKTAAVQWPKRRRFCVKLENEMQILVIVFVCQMLATEERRSSRHDEALELRKRL